MSKCECCKKGKYEPLIFKKNDDWTGDDYEEKYLVCEKCGHIKPLR